MIIDLENINGIFKKPNFLNKIVDLFFRKSFLAIMSIVAMISGLTLPNLDWSVLNWDIKNSQASNIIAGCVRSKQEISKDRVQGIEICLDENLEVVGSLNKFCTRNKNTSSNSLCDEEKLKSLFGIKTKEETGLISKFKELVGGKQESKESIGTANFSRKANYLLPETKKEIVVEQGLKVNLDENLELLSTNFYCELPDRMLPQLCDKEEFKKYIKGEVLGIFEKVN
jgi:hypothetical protein